jgi:hypothetical protein
MAFSNDIEMGGNATMRAGVTRHLLNLFDTRWDLVNTP